LDAGGAVIAAAAAAQTQRCMSCIGVSKFAVINSNIFKINMLQKCVRVQILILRDIRYTFTESVRRNYIFGQSLEELTPTVL